MNYPTIEDQLSVAVGETIETCLSAGVALDDGNIIDLLADKITDATLSELRVALSTSRYAGRWPKAERNEVRPPSEHFLLSEPQLTLLEDILKNNKPLALVIIKQVSPELYPEQMEDHILDLIYDIETLREMRSAEKNSK